MEGWTIHETREKKHTIGCFSQFVGSLACSFVATNTFSFFPSFFLHFLLYSIEIELTLMCLYDYFFAQKLHQDIAHLRHQFDSKTNFILFLKSKTMNVSYPSILSRKSYLNMFCFVFPQMKERWMR